MVFITNALQFIQNNYRYKLKSNNLAQYLNFNRMVRKIFQTNNLLVLIPMNCLNGFRKLSLVVNKSKIIKYAQVVVES